MKESFWGYMILVLGVLAIITIYFFQTITNINEHNYTLLKETTEAAMIDALDLATYRQTGIVRIDQEKFVENFVRRFASGVQLAKDYKIEIFDVNEEPPKVSIKVSSSSENNITYKLFDFSIQNKLDAILEEPANRPYETGSIPEAINYEAVPSRLESDDIKDILDTSENTFTNTENCNLGLNAYTGSIQKGKTITLNVSGQHYGTLTCESINPEIADCSMSGTKITLTAKKEGKVNILVKGSGEKVGDTKYQCSNVNYILNVVAPSCPSGSTLVEDPSLGKICVSSYTSSETYNYDYMCVAQIYTWSCPGQSYSSIDNSSVGCSADALISSYNACIAAGCSVRNVEYGTPRYYTKQTLPQASNTYMETCSSGNYSFVDYKCGDGWNTYSGSGSSIKCYKSAVPSSSSVSCPKGYKVTNNQCVRCKTVELLNGSCK